MLLLPRTFLRWPGSVVFVWISFPVVRYVAEVTTFFGLGLFFSTERVIARAICNSSSHFFQSVSWAVLFDAFDAEIKCGSIITLHSSRDEYAVFQVRQAYP